MIQLKTFVFNPFQVNTFVLWDETKECIIIDASCYEEYEFQELFDFVSKYKLTPKAVLNTHAHVDHLTGTRGICDAYKIEMHLHEAEEFLYENALSQGRTFGFDIHKPPEPASFLNEGDVFKFGNSEIKMFHAPGHSPGSMLFYMENEGFLITGDVLFSGSIGRTDLPGGDLKQLIQSIQTKILVLPGETRVFPGHGPETTVQKEMKFNPFLNRSS